VPTDVAVAPLKKDSYTGKRWHKPALFAGAGVAALLCGLGVWYFALKGTADGPLDLPGASGPPLVSMNETNDMPFLDLPGASGPPLVDLGKPPGFMPLKRIFLFFPEATKDVEAQPQLVNKMFSGKLGDTYPRQGQGWSQSFPSGTKALIVGVAFSPPPPNGTKLDVRVLSKAGPVPLRRGGFITLNGEGEIIGLLDCFPASGAFLDGPYQIEVIINDVKCALLNLRVGN
jgi:hypothetical protein